MKETIALEAPVCTMALPEHARAGLTDTLAQIKERSMIVWGEHCSECAAPACYRACQFYTPRLDGHCRRFAHGIETIGGLDGQATRIMFRRWGKLEGRGPVGPFAKDAGALREAAHVRKAKAFQFLPLARRKAWQQTEADRRISTGSCAAFNAFVIEGYSPSGKDIAFTLTCVPADKSVAALYQAKFSLGSHWSRQDFPLSDIARHLDLSQDFLIQIEPIGEADGIEIVLGLCDFVVWADGRAEGPAIVVDSAAMRPAAKAKVVVWDLDHTLWDGILLEDGIEGLSLRPQVRETMLELDARGILQSVASKNDPQAGLAALTHFGLDHLMLAPQISWNPKSVALQRLSHMLNLGLDSFVFIDDQPFERGEVGRAHPQVTILDETCVGALVSLPQFDVPVTEESRGRRALYQTEALRMAAQDDAGTDFDTFLRSCDLRLTLTPLCEPDCERVYELSQRTNQLNVAATRYSRGDVAALAEAKDGWEAWTLRCQDRFGDYGLIGFAVFQPASGRLVDFFMSCRVQRKRVESAFLRWMDRRMQQSGAKDICVTWKKAPRNGPAVDMFEATGFVLHPAPTDGPAEATHGELRRAVGGAFEGSDIVAVTEAAPLAWDLNHQ